MSIQVTNAGPEADTLHVLPTAWFRNTWSWELNAPKPVLAATGEAAVGCAASTPRRSRAFGRSRTPWATPPTLLFCENETNHGRLYGTSSSPPYPKDGINDHVVSGAATVNPDGQGTKCAFWYQVAVEPGADRRAAPAAAPSGRHPQAHHRAGRILRQGHGRPPGGGRRVLRAS